MAFYRDGDFDTVIIGNGPSALILSYILHGHIPYYVGGHEDHLLHDKLVASPDLTHLTPAIYNHIPNSSSFSSQALPVNALLDGLIRPNGDTTFLANSCVEWRYEPERAVSHVVLGNAPHAGGQWADNPVRASWDIGTLSYAEQLNLPGYSLAEFWQQTNHEPLQDMTRPTRNDLTDYLRSYPAAVGIQKAIRTSSNVSNVSRMGNGFVVAPFDISCRHIVLASGIFNINLPPPPFLAPLASLSSEQGAVVVVGSGFTAADIIISTPPHRRIIHLFNWDPVNRPSPLKACHGSAYPEYAWIYRQMKLAVERSKSQGQRKGSLTGTATRPPPNSTTLYFSRRDWSDTYEGYPNSRITSLTVDNAATTPADACNGTAHDEPHPQPSATIHIGRSSTAPAITRTITSFQYATGRRGSLAYLSPTLQQQVLRRANATPPSTSAAAANGKPSPAAATADATAPKHHDFAAPDANPAPASAPAHPPPPLISRFTLRDKIDEAAEDASAAGLELAPAVFAIGSLTGDSLIRFAYGGCAAVAGAIGGARPGQGAAALDRRKAGGAAAAAAAADKG